MNPVNWREPVSDHGKVHYTTLAVHPSATLYGDGKTTMVGGAGRGSSKKIIASVFPRNT